MWWFLKKEIDNDNEIIYSYGCETRNTTGKVKYDKTKNLFVCLKLADGDTQRAYEYLLPHIYRIIFKENAPEERQIAIG